VDLLRQCAAHLEKFGGHDMAAGVSVHESAFPAFQSAFTAAAREVATEDLLMPRLRLDVEIELHDLDSSLLEAQDAIEPFGSANHQPVFFTRSISPSGTPRVMKEKHLKIDFSAGRRRFPAVYFNARLDDLPRPPWDVAYTLDWNVWQGRAEAQMRIVDLRKAA
jgi:single-stranded-DNA-specific exonuclease